MKQIDFENGKITDNILKAALPMLVAQILSLLYNIVDRIYIARIPDIGTTALGAVGLCFPIIVIITAFSNLFGSGGAPPLPNRLLKAVMITMIGKQSPTAPRAVVPISGIRAI